MKIVKITKKTYDLNPPVWHLKLKVGVLVKKRKEMSMSYKEFETCFACDKKLELDSIPNIINVSYLGNRLICDECAKKVQENTGFPNMILSDKDYGIIKETKEYDIWFEPITDTINGFVVRNKDGSIAEVYMQEVH